MKNSEEKKYLHTFEEAGLGTAPFRIVDVSKSINWYVCDYCSTAIKEVCTIADSRGKIFIVGNECVTKTSDAGLIDLVKRELNDLRRIARHTREAQIIEAGEKLFRENEQLRALLCLKPHPDLRFADEGKTLYDYALFMFESAGNKGKLEAVKTIRAWETVEITDEMREEFSAWLERVENFQAARREKATGANADLIALLKSKPETDFTKAMIEKLENFQLAQLSDRQYAAIADIYGRSFGSPRSSKYFEACRQLSRRRDGQ